MSDAVYRLEAPRPRQPPAPLHFEYSNFTPSSPTGLSSYNHTQSLFYSLPSFRPMSPPTSPSIRSRATSPTSPTLAARQLGRPTPPPGARNRSSTPLDVSPADLEKFAEQCRAWYFDQDDDAGRLMTETMTSVPSSQRALYSRLQTSIRTAYHRSISSRRNAEFKAHLNATQPGGSLMASARADPRGALAIKERHERFARFLHSWCTVGMPGTLPFFQALWALMRLQVLPQKLGGAGPHRIRWEMDDAVFKEAAGKEFMLEAIDVLKGVLGFEETISRNISAIANGLDSYTPTANGRPLSQSFIPPKPPAASVPPNRSRAPSDPFAEGTATPGSSTINSSNGNTPNTSADSSSIPPHSAASVQTGRRSTVIDPLAFLRGVSAVEDEEEEEYLRIWTAPDLTNPEYLDLLKLFPAIVTQGTLPRFPTTLSRADIEDGDEDGHEARSITRGTGTMWVGPRGRTDGWEGGWWTRFVSWWRRMFC
ncbi:hypothetical protein AX16_010621 [Volvariella volvacea WC 439]|nr:hypothetical protein AX16_010621 [Volvariella volvacea WC 439]